MSTTQSPHTYTHTYLRTQHNTRITHCTHNKHTQFLQHSPHIYTHKCHTHPSLSSTYYSYSTTYHTPHLQYLQKITGTDNSHNSSSSHFTHPSHLHTAFTFVILRTEYTPRFHQLTTYHTPHLQYLHKITGTDNSHNSSSSHFTYPPNLHTRFTFIILRPEYNSHLKTITQLTAPLTST